MILKEMAEMTGGEKALKDYMHGAPYERDRISKGPSHDHNLSDRDLFGGALENPYEGYDEEGNSMDDLEGKFDAEVQAALDKLVDAGLLGRSEEGYYVADGDIITPEGNLDLSDVF